MMVHPARFWSHFDAKHFTCTAVAIDLFSNTTCTPSRKEEKHFRVRQSSGCTCPLAYAHNSVPRHKRIYDTPSPNHMTYHPSSILTTACHPSASVAHVKGNRTCCFLIGIPCPLPIPFPTATIMQCDKSSSHPANILWKTLIAAKYPLTVDCWLLCSKQRDVMNSSSSVCASLGSSTPCNQGPLSCIFSLSPRFSLLLSSFSE